MSQMEPKETETPPQPRKQPRQHPSVPFVWEERPGLPKKNWQPSLATFVPSAPPLPPPIPVPVKLLVTSVPFCWEETPGKPAPSSANDPPKLPQPPSKTVTAPSLPPPVPVPVKLVTSVPFHWEETPGQPYPCFVDFNPPDPLDQPLYGCEAETSSAFTVDEFDDNLNRETSSMPTSPAYDTDDSTSSYMTGASSLVGASFLEELFPRLPQEKVEAADSHHVQVTTASNDINFGFPVRAQYTLRELIMMSRRRSYMREHNPSMVEGREWRRHQRRLKLL
ncbi:BnaAnng08100D [Brassica napus]|uniref:BnaAnng08100D protein n=1 Tax=Brassica napus TaxID=3708 RepID=A0A078I9V4_BRANA|nr:BnaAnng08100D [Brassica napus]